MNLNEIKTELKEKKKIIETIFKKKVFDSL